jgi:hypothetical protein
VLSGAANDDCAGSQDALRMVRCNAIVIQPSKSVAALSNRIDFTIPRLWRRKSFPEPPKSRGSIDDFSLSGRWPEVSPGL